MLLSLELGAEDFASEDDYYEITTSPEEFSRIREELEKKEIVFEQAEIQLVPTTYVKLEGDSVKRMELLIEKLEELDDVLEVYHNWEE